MKLSSKALQVSGLLIVALAFGGGGSKAALANLVVQLAGLAALAMHPQAVLEFFRKAPRLPVALVGAALLLPLLQSIPLPASVWQYLPGRGIVEEVLTFLGQGDEWFPMSLAVRRTLLAFLSLVPVLAIVVLTWSMSAEDKRQLLFLVSVGGVLVVLLGAQQLLLGNRQFMFFSESLGSLDLHGTFANHNATGLFLDIALCALVGAIPYGGAGGRHGMGVRWTLAAVAFAVLLIVGLLLTRSRSSIFLAIVPLAFAFFRFALPFFARRSMRRLFVGGVLVGVLGLGGLGVLAVENQQIAKSLARFGSLEDRRPLIWADAMGSAGRFWPMGSGIGSFDEVFQVDESLENLGPGRAARAHNDYLEVAVESGAIGLALLAAWVAFLGLRSVQAWRSGAVEQAAASALAVIAFQSILDYPLRNQTLLCIGGFMLAILISVPLRKTDAAASRRGKMRRSVVQSDSVSGMAPSLSCAGYQSSRESRV